MLTGHREVIKNIIDLDISTINMYWGYKGDVVLKLVTSSLKVANEIVNQGHLQELSVNIKHDTSTKTYWVFCVEVDDDVIKLKDI